MATGRFMQSGSACMVERSLCGGREAAPTNDLRLFVGMQTTESGKVSQSEQHGRGRPVAWNTVARSSTG